MSCLSKRISELTLNWFCANRILSILRAVQKPGFILKLLGTDLSLCEKSDNHYIISLFSVNDCHSRVSTCKVSSERSMRWITFLGVSFVLCYGSNCYLVFHNCMSWDLNTKVLSISMMHKDAFNNWMLHTYQKYFIHISDVRLDCYLVYSVAAFLWR